MTLDASALTERLSELLRTHDVPGASLAVLHDGEVTAVAAGSLNRDAGIDATAESLFQIGSITKTFTTSLVMRLVERGELDLDVPVVTYLPDFTTADADAAQRVTLRHLLTHTSGIDGDHFLDTGRGDDVLERYVASCAELEQQFPVGATHSYCNAGFNVVGRVLEVVTGKVWDDVLRDELVAPLGLGHTMTLPEEALRFRVACGHVGDPGSVTLTPQWGIPRSSGPAGLILATASDVVAFARTMLDGGRAADGSAWLAPETVEAVLQPQVAVPNPHTLGAHWGLGWILYDAVDGRRVFGHDGSTLGQGAALRVVPDRDVAVVLLANGGGMSDLVDTLLREVLRDTADVELRPRLEPVDGASGGDRSTQAGTYRRASATMVLEPHGDAGLRLTLTNTSHLAEVMEEDEPVVVDLLPVADDTYVTRFPGDDGWSPFVFFDLEGERYVHVGARATARTER